MEDDDAPVLHGEVLPAVAGRHALAVAPARSGIPLLDRMHYRAVRRELEEYGAAVRARNAALAAITDTAHAAEAYQRALVRMERLNDLRQIEGLRIDAEMDAALESAIAEREFAHIDALRRRTERADAEALALAAERRLDALRNPPAPAPQLSAAERLTAELAAVHAEERSLIAALLDGGDTEDAPEEVQEIIRDIRFATRDRIASLIEGLGR